MHLSLSGSCSFMLEYLLVFFILFFGYLISPSGARQISICPLTNSTNVKISKLRSSLLCDTNIDCTYVKSLWNVFRTFIVINTANRQEEWARQEHLLGRLSLCRSNVVVQNAMSNALSNLANFCSNTTYSIVFAEDANMVDFSQMEIRFHQDVCSLLDGRITTIRRPVEEITVFCPLTIWVLGRFQCSANVTLVRLFNVNPIYPNSTGNWQKKVLKIGTIVDNIFVKTVQRNGSVKYVGPLFELIDLLAHTHNFSYVIYEAPDGKYGNVGPNGSWDGLVGMLKRKEVDVVAAGLVINPSRRRVIDYTEPFFLEQYGLLFRKPEPIKNIWNIVTVYSTYVWILIISSAFVAIFLLYEIQKLSIRGPADGFDTIHTTIWNVWSSMINQVELDSWTARNFLAFWWIYVLAILAVFSGTLVARLSSSIIFMPFTNVAELAELVDQGKFKLCIVDGTSTSLDIKLETFNEYKLLNAQLKKHPEFLQNSTDACKNFLVNDKTVVYIESLSQLKLVQMSTCSIVPMIILPMPIGKYKAFGLQKGFQFNQMFSAEVMDFVGAGLINFWQEQSWKKFSNNSFCEIPVLGTEVKAATVPLELKDLFIAFLAVLIGSVLGFVTFVLELCFRTAYLSFCRR